MLTDEQERDLKRIAGSLEDAGRRLADAHQLLEAVDGRVAKFVDAVQPPAAQPQTSSPPPAVRQPRASSPQPRALPASPARGMDGDGPQLPAGARKILETLARHHPMTFTRGQVGVLTGFKVSGGTFQKYWSLLKTSGYLLEENRLASVTEAGLERAGVEPAAPATTEEMLEMWSSRLPAGARAMLDHLVQMHPGWITRDELATAVEMTASGGTFQKYLSMLRTNGLADVEGGQVRASDSLFITGAVHA
jgi:hypothetical protein